MKPWLQNLLDIGLKPYVATSELYVKTIDLTVFEGQETLKFLEDPAQRSFHEGYLTANSFGFGNPDLKMPNWVYIDCVLMQTAVVGFCIPIDLAPENLIDYFERDPYVDLKELDYIPISGQIAALGLDGESLIGYSLFSLRKQLKNLNLPNLGHLTKYAALLAYKADQKKQFLGISQYNNRALQTHALFGEKMYITQPTMPLHPMRDMSFTYGMKIEFDEARILDQIPHAPHEPDFLMKSDDKAMKEQMRISMRAGEKFYIQDPIQIEKPDGLYLSICVEK